MFAPLLLLSLAAAPTLDADRTVALLERLAGSEPVLPASLTVSASDVHGAPGQVVAILDGLHDDGAGFEVRDELRRETIVGALAAADVVGGVTLYVREDDGDVRPLGRPAGALDESAREVKTRARRQARERTRHDMERFPFGAPLLGLRIAISPGHGWLANGDGTFSTQRSNFKFTGCGSTCRGIVEDFFSSETVMDQIVPLLQNMGATVLLVREGDHGIGDVAVDAENDPLIIDDGDDLYSELEGVWTDGATPGVGLFDDYRVNADTDPGRVAFSVPPFARPQRVTLRWPEGANRTGSAIVSIVHEGGVRTIDIDQRLMGRQFLDLGLFPFGSGGAVELAHGPSAGVMIADAVKVGSGLHPASRKPWWEMGAQSYVPFAGSSGDVLVRNDVTIRPAYAETLDPDVYISLHANASGAGAGSTAHGTSTYRYSCGTFGDHSSSDNATSCDDPGNSQALLDEVHAAILASVRGAWDAGWADRGRLVADFGELRELDDTPGILVETAFFDNLNTPAGVQMSDNQALHDPRFREAFAKGFVRGVARFLAPGSDAPPERPTGVRVQNVDGGLRVSWDAVAGADGYRVLRADLASTRGRAFDEGTVVLGGDVTTLDVPLAAGAFAFRVVAGNANGEGYASQAVVARVGADGAAQVLVVSAYDRKDAFVQTVDNDDMAAIEHGIALSAALDATGAGVDGALDEAVESGALSFDAYDVVDIVTGKESVEHVPVSAAMRAAIDAHLDAGGSVILSGEEIGYAMIEVAPAGEDQSAFFAATFGATYVRDDAETFELAGSALFSGVAVSLDDGSALYEVVFPDVWSADVAARPDAIAPLAYPDGSAAAIVTDNTALFGAGLEALVDDVGRGALFLALLEHLAPDVLAIPEGGEGEGEGEEGEGEEGEGEEGEGEGSEGEGEGELDIDRASILPPSTSGCGCTSSSSPSSPSDVAFALLALLALGRLSRRVGTRSCSRS